MNKLVIANWKMHPRTRREAEKLSQESDAEGLIICPPFVFLDDVSRMISRAKLGAQDVFWEEFGAYTGEISVDELKDLCVEYIIIGHSERRQLLGETDEMVARKMAAVIKSGLTPILCVGETRAEHDSGQTEAVVKRQLEKGLSLVGSHQLSVIIAYEPMWAIGTGKPDTPENMISMVKLIKEELGIIPPLAGSRLPKYYQKGGGRNLELGIKIIYGGSVNASNAESFLKHSEIDGALVGGASLKGEEIKKIVEISKKYG
ncbi:MAG: triose-phosphate isomerase [Patescibacteria group bacterium]